MNKNSIKKHYLVVLLATLILGCKDKEATTTSNPDTETTPNVETPTTTASTNENSLTCLWSKVGLRDIAGRKGAKYLSTINFGEQVKFLGETETASDKKEYVKVELSDGQQGWVYSYLFSENGKLGIVKSPLAMYKKPDIIDFMGNRFKRGDIVVVLDEKKGKWSKIVGFEKNNEGWIQESDNIIHDDLDIKLTTLYNRAINEQSNSKKQKQLKLILENPAFKESSFIDVIQNAVSSGDDDTFELEEPIDDNQLYITTEVLNVRSNPDSEADNVIFQLEKGNICTIIEKGNYETLRGNSSNWYKVEYAGNQGWVFGYFTSKK